MKKKLVSTAVLLFSTLGIVFSQDSVYTKPSPVLYSIVFNNVPDEFNYPLIGIVNNANGNHKSVQLGIVNSTAQTFKGFQSAVVNSVGKDLYGLQCGLVNSTGGKVYGVENGFINSVGDEVLGAQFGFINSTNGLKGLQDGFINSVKNDVIGMQNGFINSASGTFTGLQNGFFNSTNKTIGVQCGYINSTKSLTGVQLGFINCVDTLEAGVPIGFLSFVKHGGFSAFELGINENYLLNLSYKIGTKGFYSFPMISYNPHLLDRFAVGFGFGSNVQVSNRFFINPEVSSLFAISDNYREISSLNVGLGYSLSNRLDIIAGPSFTWTSKITSTTNQSNQHVIWIYDQSFDFINDFALGFRCAIRYTL